MPRYKDLPKIHAGTTDGYALEHSVKGSSPHVGGPVLIPAGENVFYPVEIPSEQSYAKALEDVQAQLKDIKQDIERMKEFIEKMDRNGLKMRSAW